jgi:hypothetical protein
MNDPTLIIRDIDPFFTEPEEDAKDSAPFSQELPANANEMSNPMIFRFISEFKGVMCHLTLHSGSSTVPFSHRSRMPRVKSGHSK